MEEKKLIGSHLLPDGEKPPTIIKNGETWTYTDPNRMLVSSHDTDKEFMLRMIEEWKRRNDIR